MQKTNVMLLALCQAAVMTMTSLVLSSSALIGADLASAQWATVPLAVQYLGTMLLTYPMSRWMGRWGRRPVFVMGALLGASGLLLAAAGIHQGSFTLFVVAGLLIGSFTAVGQFFRFAAAEAAPPESRSRAISLTLTGGLLAAVAGPQLARFTADVWTPAFTASFLALALVALLAAVLASRLRLSPLAAHPQSAGSASWSKLLANPRLVLAMAAGVVGYGVMNLLMTATPLAMLCSQLAFDDTASVIQWHLVAMFAPSFFTGWLIQRLGVMVVMLAGCGLNLAGIAVSLEGVSYSHYLVALMLVGGGWNFLYIGATSLLTDSCPEAEKTRVQGLNDTLVFLGLTVATMGSGALVTHLGWEVVNLWAAVPVLMVIVAIVVLWLWEQRRPGLARSSS